LAAFERVLRRGAAEDTRDWEDLNRLGWLLYRNGKYDEAQEELLRARQAWPESPWALFIGAQVNILGKARLAVLAVALAGS
jgi:tetratricopeptide (TPR) repeat protein